MLMLDGLADLPSISFIEVWGESPIYRNRCWLVRWSLAATQIEAVNQYLVAPDFLSSIQILAPTLKMEDLASSLSLIDIGEEPDSCFVETFFCLCKTILSPSILKICPSNHKIAFNGLHCAFESNQHEIAGSVIQFVAHLLEEGFSRFSKGIAFEASQRIEKELAQLFQVAKNCCGNPLTEALLVEAANRQIPFFLVNWGNRLYQYGAGSYGRFCSSSLNDSDSYIGVKAACNKRESHSLLSALGYPVPSQIRFAADISYQLLEQSITKIGFPCVIKPLDADRGEGVTAGIRDLEELKAAICFAKKSTKRSDLLLQKHFKGADFRLNVTGGRLEFAVKRSPPVIIGNGVDTVKVCIEKLNLDRRSRRASDGLSAEVNPQDKEVMACLSQAGFDMDSVIDPGYVIPLRRNSNVSTGGLREEIKVENVHPRIVSQCLSIAKTFRLDSCGIDYITTDISLDPLFHPGVFIEVNSMPQQQPARALHLLDNLFPKGTASTISCSLILANWDQGSSESAFLKLQFLIAQKPNATLACPSVLRSKVFSCLDDDVCNRLHFFCHPRELLIDKSITELICLISPELLLLKGWILSRSRIHISNFLKPLPTSDSKALFNYLKGD